MWCPCAQNSAGCHVGMQTLPDAWESSDERYALSRLMASGTRQGQRLCHKCLCRGVVQDASRGPLVLLMLFHLRVVALAEENRDGRRDSTCSV